MRPTDLLSVPGPLGRLVLVLLLAGSAWPSREAARLRGAAEIPVLARTEGPVPAPLELCPRAGAARRLLWDPFSYLDLSEDRGVKAAAPGSRPQEPTAGRTLLPCGRAEPSRI